MTATGVRVRLEQHLPHDLDLVAVWHARRLCVPVCGTLPEAVAAALLLVAQRCGGIPR
ncbi:hypothetical protein [Actinosynnema sp. ALI-1.44]|uniref:hypothetical protein n=1 Tax=Actinosynnema sp. ALI-1.44 TaxID=1933779 RepID=UPI00143D51DD|nr:hypothetical protein [Actinosynnema sp. ALI-1.44]